MNQFIAFRYQPYRRTKMTTYQRPLALLASIAITVTLWLNTAAIVVTTAAVASPMLPA
jgi:hypothetical protein